MIQREPAIRNDLIEPIGADHFTTVRRLDSPVVEEAEDRIKRLA
jgi:hypothetical protein